MPYHRLAPRLRRRSDRSRHITPAATLQTSGTFVSLIACLPILALKDALQAWKDRPNVYQRCEEFPPEHRVSIKSTI